MLNKKSLIKKKNKKLKNRHKKFFDFKEQFLKDKLKDILIENHAFFNSFSRARKTNEDFEKFLRNSYPKILKTISKDFISKNYWFVKKNGGL